MGNTRATSLATVAGPISDLYFRSKRQVLGGYRTRRTRVYGVGSAKSGTHSLVNMFSPNVRAGHEPEIFELMDALINLRQGRINDAEFTAWIHDRDRRLALEVDSSFLNYEILDLLLQEFPDAKYVLTIRDCYSWLNSLFNHSLRRRNNKDPRWLRLPLLWPPPEPIIHAPEEQVLKENGFSTLDRQFSWWTRRIGNVMTKVPAGRLLVVRTDEITKRVFEIADFCGLPHHAVRTECSHANANPEKIGFLRQMEPAFVEAKAEKHCREFMTRFFPDIRSLDDAHV
jgi:hypothetical protein